MKNKITKSIITVLLSIICFSCEKEEFYSCNPKADQWVKDNLNEIRTMTRKEWINIDNVTYQKAAFTAFTTKQRHDLWVRKFDEILTLDLAEQEQSHLLLMNDAVKNSPQWFDDYSIEKYRDQMDLFIYKWVEVAKDSLCWTDEDIYYLIGTPESIKRDINGRITKVTLMHSSKELTPGEGYGNVCNCGNDSEYLFKCPGIAGYECKVTNECTLSEKGCGAWWMDVCWGECRKAKI